MTGIQCFLVHRVNMRRERAESTAAYLCNDRDCASCGQPLFEDTFDLARVDDGELLVIGAHHWTGLPPGAMYAANMASYAGDGRAPGPGEPLFRNGPQLVVVLPSGSPWNIDGRAHNCTLPDDREHRCWVRHGVAPRVTVDKDGLTCAAGAGSIRQGDYHGWLRDGFLLTDAELLEVSQ